MNKENKKESLYERFVNRIHDERPEDPFFVVGGEFLMLSICLYWKFYDSPWNEILLYNDVSMLVWSNIGIFIVFLFSIIMLIIGFVKKYKK